MDFTLLSFYLSGKAVQWFIKTVSAQPVNCRADLGAKAKNKIKVRNMV
jgi:hypothetical protein